MALRGREVGKGMEEGVEVGVAKLWSQGGHTGALTMTGQGPVLHMLTPLTHSTRP